jgi:hypothetical protein
MRGITVRGVDCTPCPYLADDSVLPRLRLSFETLMILYRDRGKQCDQKNIQNQRRTEILDKN